MMMRMMAIMTVTLMTMMMMMMAIMTTTIMMMMSAEPRDQSYPASKSDLHHHTSLVL